MLICLRRSLAVALIALVVGAPAAAANRPLALAFFDPLFASPGPDATRVYDRAVESGASIVRVQVSWPANTRPANPTDPADPAYAFAPLDDAIRAASTRGLQILVSFTGAPSWAEGPGRPTTAPPGSWRPDPSAVGAYGEALARRYSGAYPDPRSPGQTLPRAAAFQVWNEPNLAKYLTPQWTRVRGRVVAAAPELYRRMLNAFYAGVKRAQKDALVVTAGTAPFGDSQPGGRRIQPVRFLREMLSRTTHFNVLAHHPYSVAGPFRKALNADDVSVPDLGKLKTVLRAAQRAGRVLPRGPKRLWVTEVSWDSNPPDPDGVPEAVQARWLAQALYVLWRQRVDSVFWFRVEDSPPDPSYAATNQSGVYLLDGRAKLSQRAFAFPFVAVKHGGQAVLVWARSPAAGSLVFERLRAGSWVAVRSVQVGRGQVVQRILVLNSARGLRARIADATSLST